MRCAAFDAVALVDLQPRAILHARDRTLGPVRPDDDHRDVARHHHQIAIPVARQMAVADMDHAVEIRLGEGLIRELRRAADVEGAHGELRAGLADRLRRDDADRLAHVDRHAARQIAPVTSRADPVLGLAGQHRADLHLLNAGGVDRLDMPFLNHRRPRARSPSRPARANPPPRNGRECAIASDATTWPASMIARMRMPFVEPQS